MNSARELFAQKGFYATPTALIAKQAGVSNGILFHYFPTKDVLINALYNDLKDRMFSYSVGQVYKAATVKESIYTLWLAIIEWNIENEHDFDFVRQYENSSYYDQNNERAHRYVQLFLEFIQKGIDEQRFKPMDPFFLYKLISSMVQSTVLHVRSNAQLINEAEKKNQLFELVWDALKSNTQV